MLRGPRLQPAALAKSHYCSENAIMVRRPTGCQDSAFQPGSSQALLQLTCIPTLVRGRPPVNRERSFILRNPHWTGEIHHALCFLLTSALHHKKGIPAQGVLNHTIRTGQRPLRNCRAQGKQKIQPALPVHRSSAHSKNPATAICQPYKDSVAGAVAVDPHPKCCRFSRDGIVRVSCGYQTNEFQSGGQMIVHFHTTHSRERRPSHGTGDADRLPRW